MKRLLIVNADDCNLTPGVTKAILDCHDRGILTSTTFMINLPVETPTVRALIKRKNLGVGLHLNMTLGQPVSHPKQIRSLLSSEGRFRKVHEQLAKPPRAGEILTEYQNQIRRFRKIFGRLPTHLDTHHQIHDRPFFFQLLLKTARKNGLPVRRSQQTLTGIQKSSYKTTDYFFGNLTTEGYWRKEALETILKNLPEGVSEMMCHPGKNDASLKKISSFTAGREVEWHLFRAPFFKQLISRLGVTLTHFGLCYTSRV